MNQTILFKKRAKDLSRHFSKEDVHMVSRYTNRCSPLLAVWEL